MEFAKGYEDGFKGVAAQSNAAAYMKGYRLGVTQAARANAGDNCKLIARVPK